jgi:polyadenylate-binding protein
MSSNKSISSNTTASLSTSATGTTFRFPNKLFLQVSPSTTGSELKLVAENYGRVRDVHIPKSEHKQSRGFAFVTFQRHDDAAAAMEGLDGSRLEGMLLHPRWAAPKKTSKQERVNPKRNRSRKKEVRREKVLKEDVSATTPDSNTIASVSTGTGSTFRFPNKLFLKVSPSTTDSELKLVIENYGRVRDVHIPKNEHKQSRGFAFVTFQRHDDAAAAMEGLNGSRLKGMLLNPRWAAPKKTNKQGRVNPERNASPSTTDSEPKLVAEQYDVDFPPLY